MNIQNIHTQHIILVGYCIAHLAFLIDGKKYIQEALKEKGVPSSLRLTGFMFANAIVFAFVWQCVWRWLDNTQLLYMLVAMGALYSIIKASQVLEFKNGKQAQSPPPAPPAAETETSNQ